MNQPDYHAAASYMLQKLDMSLPANYHYHNTAHTVQVLDSTELIARGENIAEDKLLLLKTAAVYHDCGFMEQYQTNEPVAARIAGEVLPQFNYSAHQIEFVKRLILVTAIGAEPIDLFEEIIKDADFDYLGTENYVPVSLLLKKEWETQGMTYSTADWFLLQQKFLTNHRYYTATAQQLRNAHKQKNLNDIEQQLMALH
jgi:predicted metal-dependent HD superfamily phosphohydrolase